MKNIDVRDEAKKRGVYLWQIAEEMGMQDSGLSKKLRKELMPNEKEQVFAIIRKLSEEVR
jgi:hypothetical protein